MPIFLLAFIVLPILEMVVLIEVGSVIGALNTVGLVLLTAVIGAALLRRQGLATLMRANERMATGEIPAREMAEGILLAVGGALLLTPGFITDGVGFLCLLPGSRQWLVGKLMRRMTMSGGNAFVFTQRGPFTQNDPFGQGDPFGRGEPGGPRRDARGNVIIDGDYEREDEAGSDAGDRESRHLEHRDNPDERS